MRNVSRQMLLNAQQADEVKVWIDSAPCEVHERICYSATLTLHCSIGSSRWKHVVTRRECVSQAHAFLQMGNEIARLGAGLHSAEIEVMMRELQPSLFSE